MEKKARILSLMLICFFASFCYQGTTSTAHGEEVYPKTMVDPRDIYLSLDAIYGYEGLPYEFMIPKDEYVKMKSDPADIYVDLDDFISEDMPSKDLVVPDKHMKTKIDYKEDRKIGLEEMISEDPTILEIKYNK